MATEKQHERQKHRDRTGKYDKVNPCYHCGKSAGVDYQSSRLTDNKLGDEGLCLCLKCAVFLEQLSDDEIIRRLKLSKYGANPQPRK